LDGEKFSIDMLYLKVPHIDKKINGKSKFVVGNTVTNYFIEYILENKVRFLLSE
jgi:hypothetical protein